MVNSILRAAAPLGLALILAGCATTAGVPDVVQAPPEVAAAQTAVAAPPPGVKVLKRKIAIGRFTNTSNYGRALLTQAQLTALGDRTSDTLAARLIESQRFLIFERPDIDLVQNESLLTGQKIDIVGVDTLIVGSLTEFGRKTEGRAGFASNTKRQTARAKVDLRLVDARTGRAYFSTSGTGAASVETGTVLGFGERAAYDETLNDRAIAAAISEVIDGLVRKLEERRWRSDILKVRGDEVIIAGGSRQGLAPGDRLEVLVAGEQVKSTTSGLSIDLPPTPVAEIEVVSTFGEDETNEGAICRVVSGRVPAPGPNVFVSEL